jgi:hypothetical protein
MILNKEINIKFYYIGLQRGLTMRTYSVWQMRRK